MTKPRVIFSIHLCHVLLYRYDDADCQHPLTTHDIKYYSFINDQAMHVVSFKYKNCNSRDIEKLHF